MAGGEARNEQMKISTIAMATVMALAMSAGAAAQVPSDKPAGPMPPPMKPKDPIRTEVHVADGKVVVARLAGDRVVGANRINGRGAKGISISTVNDANALYVSGKGSAFTLTDATIDVRGQGSHEFGGLGAGAIVGHDGSMTLRRVKIATHAAGASAVVASTGATMRVYDSELVTFGGPLPPNSWQPPIGVTGSARTALIMLGGKLYLYNTKIRADGWGALSSDAEGSYIECNMCDISTVKSGYGLFSDAGVNVVVNKSKIDATTYGGIIAENGTLALNDTDTQSRGQGIVSFNVLSSGQEVGKLAINGGSMHSAQDLLLLRSANLAITVDHAVLKADNNVLLHAVVNHDPMASKPSTRPPGTDLTLRNSQASGDIVNEDTDRDVRVHLVGSQLRGALRHAAIDVPSGSTWLATGNSDVVINNADAARIDAAAGVTITARCAGREGSQQSLVLKSGGRLVLNCAT